MSPEINTWVNLVQSDQTTWPDWNTEVLINFGGTVTSGFLESYDSSGLSFTYAKYDNQTGTVVFSTQDNVSKWSPMVKKP